MYNFPIFVEDLLVHSEIKSNQINTNTMKIKHLFLSALALTAMVAVGCNKEGGNDTDTPNISVEPSSITFEIGDLEAKTVKVTSNRDLRIEDVKESWLKAEKVSDTEAKITVTEANSGKNRPATVKFRVPGKKAELSVLQKGEGGAVVPVEDGDGTAEKPYSVAQAIENTKALDEDSKLENIYTKGIISSLTEYGSTLNDKGEPYGNYSYKISDDGTTAKEFIVYRGYGIDGAKFTAPNNLKVGDVVVIVGTLKNFNGKTPEYDSGNKLVSINGGTDVHPGFAVSVQALSASANETSAKFVVMSDVAWTAKSETAGFTVSPASGDKGFTEVTISFAANTSTTSEKTAKITVATTDERIDTKSIEVTLVQKAALGGGKTEVKLVIDHIKKDFSETSDKKGFTATSKGVTITYKKAGTSSTAAVAPTDLLKLYKNHEMTISAAGKKISQVEFACLSSHCEEITVNSDKDRVVKPSGTNLLWTGDAVETFKCTATGGQLRITTITVIVE